MNNTPMIYSTNARWYVSIPAAIDRQGRIRRALVMSSPHYDVPHFVELARSTELNDYDAQAAALIERLFWAEEWYRRPLQIRCDTVELTSLVAAKLGEHTHVRTDARARRFTAAAAEFHQLVLDEGFKIVRTS